MAKLEFCGKSIIADWGNSRTYFVTDIDFDSNPLKKTFLYNNKQISVAQYFQDAYGKKVSDTRQPLFLIKIADSEHYLPPEFCLLDGVPDSVRKGAGMRDALRQTHITPDEKLARVQKMCQNLLSQKAIKQWDL